MNVLPVRVTKNRYLLVDYSVPQERGVMMLDWHKSVPFYATSYEDALKAAHSAVDSWKSGWPAAFAPKYIPVEQFDARLIDYRAATLRLK